MDIPSKFRFPFLLLAVLGLAAALLGGLYRIGWGIEGVPPLLALTHGPLMVSGFLGTLIALERAVALQKFWWYVAPAACGIGTLLMLAMPTAFLMYLALFWIASLLYTLAMIVVYFRRSTLATAIMLGGGVLWCGGNGLWILGIPLPVLVWWWAGFLIFTIAGERLELSGLQKLSGRAVAVFGIALLLYLAGMIGHTYGLAAGHSLIGAALILLGMWLLRFDLTRRTIRLSGLTRFVAVALLSGYGWLLLAGIMMLFGEPVTAGPPYDALLHAIFLGFVFSMIFGHAPLIFPAILGVKFDFRNIFYGHLALLHLSLLLRIAGDHMGSLPLRKWGALLNAAAIVWFFANTLYSALRSRQREKAAV